MELQPRIRTARDFLALHAANNVDTWIPDDLIKRLPENLKARQLKYLMVYRQLCWGIYGPVLRLSGGRRAITIPGRETTGGNDELFIWRELDEF